MGLCPLCGRRKGKRHCPAKGAHICAHCCGTKRLVEVDCPTGCVYLDGGHAGTWDGRHSERNRDTQLLAPHVSAFDDTQAQLLLMTLAGIHQIRIRRRDVTDRILLEAVAALRKTFETRQRGVLYEHPAGDLRAQGLLFDLRELFVAKQKQASPSDGDVLKVLTAVEGCLVDALAEGGSSIFLDAASRLAIRFAGGPRTPVAPSLIVEP